MFDHVQIKVSDYAKSRPFYEAVMKTLGYGVVFEDKNVVGFGTNPHDMFEIRQASEKIPLSAATHIAFSAKNEDAVRAFYTTALELGAKDNGKPDFRDYEPGYFAAFIIDPNGHNLEAVFKK
ncbi:MAG: VOC family protein [Patescibacteria group bacterium]|nr:VOC family protein [Patescibacteria group bacterium]